MSDQFSFRATRIMEDILNAAQQAEELDGIEDLEEYVRTMVTLSEEFARRARVAVVRLLEDES